MRRASPFYGGFGRNRLFTDADIERIRTAYLGRSDKERRTIASAASSSQLESQLAEVRALLENSSRRRAKHPAQKQTQRRFTLGVAIRSAIEKMVQLEVGNEDQMARAAELITAAPDEFARRFRGGP
jgi:DNA-binding transcriptional MerR regulator